MVINENNSYINTFTSGMNSDSSYDQIDNKHYVYGKNIRITKNQLLGGYDDYATQHEGIVTPVPDGTFLSDINYEGKILAVDSVDNLCTIVTSENKNLCVYKMIIENDNIASDGVKLIWKADNFWSGDVPDKISTVLYKELENVTKLYIATGEVPLIIIRVDDEKEVRETLIQNNEYTPVDCLINNRIVPQNIVYIDKVISGRLKTQQVLYTYRLYNKYANTTQLAPLTNKIQVIDSSRSKENGNAEDTETSLGFALKIKKEDYWKYFKRIQVYRLSFIKPGEPAEVSLIYDDKLTDTNYFEINDIGIEPLQTLTIEEFGAMSGLILIPQVIEQNLNYMFCGNVKDDTIIKDITVTPGDFELVLAKVTLAKEIDGCIPHDDKEPFVNGEFNYTNYFSLHNINPELAKSSYENIFTSSLLRSLRRDETYKYAIVFYDKYGRRTDVYKLADVHVDTDTVDKLGFEIDSNNYLIAKPVGVKFTIPTIQYDHKEDIVGCQIVRRGSSDVYQKTLLQVALARPVSLGLSLENQDELPEEPTKYSPYYPTGFLGVNHLVIQPSYYKKGSDNILMDNYTNYWATMKNSKLFQIFSSEIDYRREDVLERLSTSDMDMIELAYLYSNGKVYGGIKEPNDFFGLSTYIDNRGLLIFRPDTEKLSQNDKVDFYSIFNYFEIEKQGPSYIGENKVKSIKDVKIPNWEDGFTNVLRAEDQHIYSAIKKYKQFTTGIDEFTYNNWCSFGKYDFRPGVESLANVPNQDYWLGELLGVPSLFLDWLTKTDGLNATRTGYIGAGGSCMLLTTEEDKQKTINNVFPTYKQNTFYTSICNITHNILLNNVEAEETTTYYGFGNYFPLKYNGERFVTNYNEDTITVFDGDVYITPHELTTMYKTYNFESADTILSTLITNYIPLESKVNTFFDYGMNLRNTNSANLLYEPGNVDGVTGQDRPAHLYNMIYSDNDTSNDVFTLISTDKNETNQFKQRAYFSEPKTNGEFIDNFPIFKTASFIDVDSQYGQITNMDTDKNNLFYWQDHAFGKFSVNERSLINDLNGNTIMLGQAGILSRYDYLSTKYGMRLHDLCSRTTENGLFWVDINNKAVVGSAQNGVVNYGEQTFVLNLINNYISEDVPYVDYDIQNNELLCKCFKDEEQIIFNVKYNVATSVYNREYDAIVYIKNHLFGINNQKLYKFNYTDNNWEKDLLSPMMLEFVVNPNTSITKVFDSQQIVPIKRSEVLPDTFNESTAVLFETDLYKGEYTKMNNVYTDREGNIIYNVPRFGNKEYGNRLRGKWMKVSMNNENPSEYCTVSHVITKFRQSFS